MDVHQKAARYGEPSYIWREGQARRLEMMVKGAGLCLQGKVLDNGCGVGMYVEHLAPYAETIIGLEYDLGRAQTARQRAKHIVNGAGEFLPFSTASFDLILSHEVLEHVQEDQLAVNEMVRVLRPGGRILLFVPNRGYPFETHGIYWRGRYVFGNIPLVNYLPRALRQHLAWHVRAYSTKDLEKLFHDTPVKVIERMIIFGGYDNLIANYKSLGKLLRFLLQAFEHTPLRWLGLSHFWVIEKQPSQVRKS